jgi:hypothetical protein
MCVQAVVLLGFSVFFWMTSNKSANDKAATYGIFGAISLAAAVVLIVLYPVKFSGPETAHVVTSTTTSTETGGK